MTERRYLPTIADLIDRLSISLMKSIFIDRESYRAEMKLIREDLSNMLHSPDAEYAWWDVIYPVLALMLANRYIWENEAFIRNGFYDKTRTPTEVADILRLTHSINGVRTRAKNEISKIFGERIDGKVDCLAADLPSDMGNWRVFDD